MEKRISSVVKNHIYELFFASFFKNYQVFLFYLFYFTA